MVILPRKITTKLGPEASMSGLKSFGDYYQKKHRSVIVYLGAAQKLIDGIRILPWQEFLKNLGL